MNTMQQRDKPWHLQAAEILGHIHNRDYGLAESKAGLLRDQLQKGDWTLGGGKHLKYSTIIEYLEDELGDCRHDSKVLMKVVDITKDESVSNSKAMCLIRNLVDEYLDAPEGPPDTLLDETVITVSFRGTKER